MTIGEPAMPGGTWVDFRALITIDARTLTSRWAITVDGSRKQCYLPLLQALFLLREGLPPNVRPFVPEPIVGMTLDGMIEATMEAEIIVHGMQATAPEGDQVVPVYDADIAEAGAENDVMDPADIPVDPEDHSEDPPVIIIESDDEEEDEEENFDDLEEPEEDPEEILCNAPNSHAGSSPYILNLKLGLKYLSISSTELSHLI
nr:hypothetical protein TIFTF001_040087 [Ficus carica]